MKLRTSSALFSLAIVPLASAAPIVTVRVTNHQPVGGFTFSPPWVAFHDGTFDAFNSGAPASPGVEGIAELGDGTTISAEFAGSGASGVTGMVMSPNSPPPFIPGETGSAMIDVVNASTNRYFSFGAMLVPSNDFFLGNDSPTAHEIFDAAGNFLGPVTIQIFANQAWEGGTEVNNLSDGAAFIVGQDAAMGTSESGVVAPLFSVPGNDVFLASIVGQETPIGTLTDGLTSDELVATIEILPEPGTLALLGFAGLALVRRRR